MYHIPNDKRAIHSAQKLCESFNKLMREKRLNEITVSELQRNSRISRATIYRLFDMPTDILLYQMTKIFEDASQTVAEKNITNLDEMLLELLKIWTSHKEIWQVAYDNQRCDLIFSTHNEFINRQKADLIQKAGIDEIQIVYLTSFISATFTSLLLSWLRTGAIDTPEEIHRRMKENLRCLLELEKIDISKIDPPQAE